MNETRNGILCNLKSKKRKLLNIPQETKALDNLVSNPPQKDECYKMVSVGGFSSIAIIRYVASREHIRNLYVSTFRIGHKQFESLLLMHRKGQLDMVHAITSTTQKNTDKDYAYYETILKKCKGNGWNLKVYNNHSKLILMETDENRYVVETSSNLNENPKIGQFSWENDGVLFEWYKGILLSIMDMA